MFADTYKMYVVVNQRLIKSSAIYLKDYMNRVLAKLEENSRDQVEIFKTNMCKAMEDTLGGSKDLQFFAVYRCVVAPMENRVIKGQRVPVLMFFKHGLEDHKF